MLIEIKGLNPSKQQVRTANVAGFTPAFGEVNSPLHHQTETLPKGGPW
jgi:hypothetical protein